MKKVFLLFGAIMVLMSACKKTDNDELISTFHHRVFKAEVSNTDNRCQQNGISAQKAGGNELVSQATQ